MALNLGHCVNAGDLALSKSSDEGRIALDVSTDVFEVDGLAPDGILGGFAVGLTVSSEYEDG